METIKSNKISQIKINQNKLKSYKMKRYNNISDVAHAWANKLSSDGKSSNLYFEGNEIYSYGSHYLLAKFIEVDGLECVWINDKGYSSSTSKHISLVRMASSHYRQFYWSESDQYAVRMTLEKLIKKIATAKSNKYTYLKNGIDLFEKYMQYPNDRTNKIHNDIVDLHNKFLAFDVEAIRIECEAKKAKAAKRTPKGLEHYVKKFKKYEIQRIQFRLSGNIMLSYLRISQDGKYVETSQRVKIPIEDARQDYLAITDKIYEVTKIGGFTVNEISDDFLKVGCHTIEMSEVHSIGKQLIQA